MNPVGLRASSITLAGFFTLAGFASASVTKKVGGGGGERTVTMDCGSNAFIVGASAKGGKDTFIAPNLVRSVQFKCRTFNGTTPGATTTKTGVARGTTSATSEVTEKSADCPESMVATALDLYAGLYLDRFDQVICHDSKLSQQEADLNVGGSGGARSSIDCPVGEGLYKVEARVGSVIDSLKGYCRTFGGVEDMPPHVQINDGLRPSASHDDPVKIAPGQSRTFSFNVPTSGVNDRLLLLVSAQTDLLGGGVANMPEYKLELRNPSGETVKTKTVTRTEYIQEIPVEFDVAGAWKVRVTNLKKDYGALEVTRFSVAPQPPPGGRRTW